MLKTTATRLFSALLGYVMLIILLMTLNPFYLSMPDQISVTFRSSADNFILNIILFLPVGFLYRLITKQRGALLAGAVLSLGIETMQLFIPARTPSAMDVLSNSLGAGLGGSLYYLISTRINVTPRILYSLRLETPLMALTYLLVPLLWIDTLALPEAPYRWILTSIIGIFGAIIFSSLFRHWEPVLDYRMVGYAALATGLWFIIGVGPSVLHPHGMILIAIGVMLITAILTVLPQSNQDRRFERPTLMRLVPMIALYLVLLSLGFPFSPFGAWHAFLGFTDRSTETSLYALYPRLEYLAAYTVLGYLIAEWRGRLELPLMKDFPRLVFLAMSIALPLEILSGFQSGRGASLVRLLLAVAGALFGGTIYHLSRAHIRYLLGR